MRFAGTWKQYSRNAIPQLARITFQRPSLRYFKWPYQAKVMKMFEMVSKTMVRNLARPLPEKKFHLLSCWTYLGEQMFQVTLSCHSLPGCAVHREVGCFSSSELPRFD